MTIHPSLLTPRCPYCGSEAVGKVKGQLWDFTTDDQGNSIYTQPHSCPERAAAIKESR